MKTLTDKFFASAILDAVNAGSISPVNVDQLAEILYDAARGLLSDPETGERLETGLRAKKGETLSDLADALGEEEGRRERLAERIAEMKRGK